MAVGVRRGHRTPAHRVDEAGQRRGIVEAVRGDVFGQPLSGGDGFVDLQLPDYRDLLPQPVLGEGLQVDDVAQRGGGVIGGAERKACTWMFATAQVEPHTSTTWPGSGTIGAAVGTDDPPLDSVGRTLSRGEPAI